MLSQNSSRGSRIKDKLRWLNLMTFKAECVDIALLRGWVYPLWIPDPPTLTDWIFSSATPKPRGKAPEGRRSGGLGEDVFEENCHCAILLPLPKPSDRAYSFRVWRAQPCLCFLEPGMGHRKEGRFWVILRRISLKSASWRDEIITVQKSRREARELLEGP